MSIRKILTIAAVAATFAGLGGNAMAATNWQKSHPRRTEVNKRLANQNRRVHREVKEGEMSKGQAAQLHKDDRQVRQEERDMSSQNGGHITKPEQRVLNHQENGVSKQIG